MLLAVAIFLGTFPGSPGMASVTVGAVIESASGHVLVNLYGNHYIPPEYLFPAVHEVEALDVVRAVLLREKRIRNLPILIEGGWKPYGETNVRGLGIIEEDSCIASFGETTTPPRYIGPCYAIDPKGGPFVDLLAMTVALPRLRQGVTNVQVGDPAAFRAGQAQATRPFRTLSLHFDPIWSPDGSRLLYTVWEPAGVRLEILDAASGAKIRLTAGQDLYARPLWSPDGSFIAAATLRAEVRLFDARTGAYQVFRSREGTPEFGIVMLFESGALHFAFSRGGETESYRYDLSRRELQPVSADAWRPHRLDKSRGYGMALDTHSSLRPVRSPSGRYVALFTFVDGQRRILIKTLQ